MKTALVISKSAPMYSQYRLFLGMSLCLPISLFTNEWHYVKMCNPPPSLGCRDPAPEGERHNSVDPDH